MVLILDVLLPFHQIHFSFGTRTFLTSENPIMDSKGPPTDDRTICEGMVLAV